MTKFYFNLLLPSITLLIGAFIGYQIGHSNRTKADANMTKSKEPIKEESADCEISLREYRTLDFQTTGDAEAAEIVAGYLSDGKIMASELSLYYQWLTDRIAKKQLDEREEIKALLLNRAMEDSDAPKQKP